jgi:hypothetical protein
MKRTIWITAGILLVLALAFVWLASTPAEPDVGQTFFRNPNSKLPPMAEHHANGER